MLSEEPRILPSPRPRIIFLRQGSRSPSKRCPLHLFTPLQQPSQTPSLVSELAGPREGE